VMFVLIVWGMAHSGGKVAAILFPRPRHRSPEV